MGLFRGIFGPKKPKKIGDYEIKETVRCAKCGRKMHLPTEWLRLSMEKKFDIVEGSQCTLCKKYYCFNCTFELDKPGWRPETAGWTFKCKYGCGSSFYKIHYIEQ